jgi:ribosome-binding factor A
MDYFIAVRSSKPGMLFLITQIKCTTDLNDAVTFATNQFIGDLDKWDMYIFHCKYHNEKYEILKSVVLFDVIDSIQDDEGHYQNKDVAMETINKLTKIVWYHSATIYSKGIQDTKSYEEKQMEKELEEEKEIERKISKEKLYKYRVIYSIPIMKLINPAPQNSVVKFKWNNRFIPFKVNDVYATSL